MRGIWRRRQCSDRDALLMLSSTLPPVSTFLSDASALPYVGQGVTLWDVQG